MTDNSKILRHKNALSIFNLGGGNIFFVQKITFSQKKFALKLSSKQTTGFLYPLFQ